MNEEVSVRELMNREYVGVSESDDLIETVELLLREDAAAAVVQRGNEHIGVVTERDILASLVEGPPPAEATVGDVMSESVPTVDPEMSLGQAADKMSTLGESRVVVANGSEPLGVLTERDLLASRTHAVESRAADDPVESSVTGSGSTVTVESVGDEGIEDHFDDQSICEVCGSLSPDLSPFNGQLVCPNCRTI